MGGPAMYLAQIYDTNMNSNLGEADIAVPPIVREKTAHPNVPGVRSVPREEFELDVTTEEGRQEVDELLAKEAEGALEKREFAAVGEQHDDEEMEVLTQMLPMYKNLVKIDLS